MNLTHQRDEPGRDTRVRAHTLPYAPLPQFAPCGSNGYSPGSHIWFSRRTWSLGPDARKRPRLRLRLGVLHVLLRRICGRGLV